MSETGNAQPQNASTDPNAGTGAQPPTEQAPTIESLQAEVDKWKGFSRLNEDRAKANAAAAAELQKIKDAQKSAEERLSDALKAAETEAAAAKADLLCHEVAAVKGVPAALLKGLGKTKEELEAAADQLLSWRGHPQAGPTQQPTTAPQNPLKQGAQGAAAGTDANAVLRRLAGF